MNITVVEKGGTIPAPFQAEAPDAHVTLGEGSHLSLWWREVPEPCIGHFEADSPETAKELIGGALDWLRERGIHRVIGPMDGNTWNHYRFVSGGFEGAPPFFLEPVNPPYYPKVFEEAGFRPLATYSSSRLDLAEEPRDLSRVEKRLARRGIRIRGLRPDQFGAELERLHGLSLLAFADNFLYTAIDRAAFLQLYAGIEPLIVPEFVLLAEATAGSGEAVPVAFVFALPDVLEQKREGRAARCLIVKTLATHPEWRHLGIGSVLVERVQASARSLGFTHAIHALQHETNTSLKITRRSQGQRIREYTLYVRDE